MMGAYRLRNFLSETLIVGIFTADCKFVCKLIYIFGFYDVGVGFADKVEECRTTHFLPTVNT